ncbi:MAG TPA: pilus assembly protein N-terminal domain-containing protein [Caulobacteraceae bacterium]|jgi:hypothetical protein
MRKLLPSLILALAPATAFAATALDLPLDQSALVTLPGPARDVIVGNPSIADVSVADRRHLVVTAKGSGVTNLLVTDASGRAMLSEEIVVGAVGGNRVALFNGPQLQSYNCTFRCEQVSGPANGGQAAGGAPATPAIPPPSGPITASPGLP